VTSSTPNPTGRYIRNIVISSSDAARLADFYCRVLGWRILRRDWLVIGKDEQTFPRLAFDSEGGAYIPPRWPDRDLPAQVHLDLPAGDFESAARQVEPLGAPLLRRATSHHVYVDPDGHPFCVYETGEAGGFTGDVGFVTLDCGDPEALAGFYQELLGYDRRIGDPAAGWVGLAPKGIMPGLGFERSDRKAPRWPDPAYPQQMHMDLHTPDGPADVERALSLGATRLPTMGGSCPVLADPAGHPFCLCSPNQ
jgi:catechol 2,3-dioxygenase-like lactoylglutathione lyase family enzyme